MKKIYGRFAAFALSALTAVSAASAFPVMAETGSEEEKMVTVHFDLSDENIRFDTDEDGNILEITDITTTANSSVRIPDIYIYKNNYGFSGWTVDGVRGYAMNSVIQVGEEDITLTPVWYVPKDKVLYDVEYRVEINGEIMELPKSLDTHSQQPGTLVNVSLFAYDYPNSEYSQIGWNYDGNTYLGQQYIVMPDHDIVLTPNWLKYYKLRYTPGDVDRLNGATSGEFDRLEKQPTGLAEAGRFSRSGFKITGWSCDADGQIYAPQANYIMPSQDVTFTAVWDPITYNVVFNGNTGKASDIIKVEGKTDTTIICPESTAVKEGYYFAGWKFDEKVNGVTTSTIYQPGDEFLIKGAKPGMGIALTAVWKEGTPPVTDPKVKYGDANNDGEIALSDAVLVMQSIGNPDAYGIGGTDPYALTDAGYKNADCYNTGDGLTNMDALSIQRYLLKLIDVLPVQV